MSRYITTKDIIAHSPAPNSKGEPDYTPIPKGTILELEDFSEYDMEFLYNGVVVALSRERVCHEPSDPKYYDNYFALPEGIDKYDQ